MCASAFCFEARRSCARLARASMALAPCGRTTAPIGRKRARVPKPECQRHQNSAWLGCLLAHRRLTASPPVECVQSVCTYTNAHTHTHTSIRRHARVAFVVHAHHARCKTRFGRFARWRAHKSRGCYCHATHQQFSPLFTTI